MAEAGMKGERSLRMLVALWLSACLVFIGYIVRELPNPDAIWSSTVYKDGAVQEISLGRFALNLFQKLTSYTISPSVTVILTLLLLACSALCLLDLLQIRKTWMRYLLGMILLTSPHVQSLVTYYYCELYYAAAMLMAVVILRLICGDPTVRRIVPAEGTGEARTHTLSGDQKWIALSRGILGVILTVLMLATYQAYLSVVVTGWLVITALRLLDGGSVQGTKRRMHDTGSVKAAELRTHGDNSAQTREQSKEKSKQGEAKTALHQAIGYVLRMLLVTGSGSVIYLLCNKVLLSHYGLAQTSGAGSATMLRIVHDIPQNLHWMPYYYKEYFLGNVLLNNSYKVMGLIPRRAVNVLWILVTAAALIVLLVDRSSGKHFGIKRKAEAVILLLLVPFGSMLMLLASVIRGLDQPTGSLMLPAMALSYMAAAAIAERAGDVVAGKRKQRDVKHSDVSNETKMCEAGDKTKTCDDSSCDLQDEKIGKGIFSQIIGVCTLLTVIMLGQMTLDGARYQQYRMDQMDQVGTMLAQTIIGEIASEPGLPVIIAGQMEYGNFPDRYREKLKPSIQWLVQSYGTVWSDYHGTQEVWRYYLMDRKGIMTYYTPDYETNARIQESPEFIQMTKYPEEGSVRRIHDEVTRDVLVIKLGDQ